MENNGGTAAKGTGGKTVSQRELAALSVEHEMLTAQVADMKRFLQENQGSKGDQSMTYAAGQKTQQEIEELEEEIQQYQQENTDLNQQMEELGINYRTIEQQLVESKLQAATLDMEADQLSVELTQKNELIKKF